MSAGPLVPLDYRDPAGQTWWRCSGRLDAGNRKIADGFDRLVQTGRISAYRRTTSGNWSIRTTSGRSRPLGGRSQAEAFLIGTSL